MNGSLGRVVIFGDRREAGLVFVWQVQGSFVGPDFLWSIIGSF